MILLHGRGTSAEDILSLAPELGLEGFAWWAPQATNATWYPYRFLEPPERNEPWLSSALALIAGMAEEAGQLGMPKDRIWITGFSQGACLSLEFAARSGTRWGGVAAFSGGLIGDRIYREITRRTWGHAPFLSGRAILTRTFPFLGCANPRKSCGA